MFTPVSDCSKDALESVLRETLFESRDRGDHNTSGTISEIKRRLENLNLLHHSQAFKGEGDRIEIVAANPGLDCDSTESTESEDDDAEMDENRTGVSDLETLCDNKSEYTEISEGDLRLRRIIYTLYNSLRMLYTFCMSIIFYN